MHMFLVWLLCADVGLSNAMMGEMLEMDGFFQLFKQGYVYKWPGNPDCSKVSPTAIWRKRKKALTIKVLTVKFSVILIQS